MKILFVNACISANNPSRTKRLCEKCLERLAADKSAELEEIDLSQSGIQPFTEEKVEKRMKLAAKKDFSDEMFLYAKQFKSADLVVIGAPYWDLSFPSLLKVYIENIMVTDLTFTCTETGFKGLCGAKELVYITTAGGYIGNRNFGYEYIREAAHMLGIGKTSFFYADGLDIYGNNPDDIMARAIDTIENSLGEN